MTDNDLRNKIALWLYRRFLNPNWETYGLWDSETEAIRQEWFDAADSLIQELNLDVSVRYHTSCGVEVCLEGHYVDYTNVGRAK